MEIKNNILTLTLKNDLKNQSKESIQESINEEFQKYKQNITFDKSFRKLRKKSLTCYLLVILNYIAISLSFAFFTLSGGPVGACAEITIGSGGPGLDFFDEIFSFIGYMKQGIDNLEQKANDNTLTSDDLKDYLEKIVLLFLITPIIMYLLEKANNFVSHFSQYAILIQI